MLDESIIWLGLLKEALDRSREKWQRGRVASAQVVQRLWRRLTERLPGERREPVLPVAD